MLQNIYLWIITTKIWYIQSINVGIWNNIVIFSKEIEMSKGEIQDSMACMKQNDPFKDWI